MNALIPEDRKGKSVDLEQSSTCQTITQARQLYNKACERLQHPYTWHELTGTPGAGFSVVDRVSRKIKNAIEVKDYIQVDIPAPGPAAGDGHDWVQVDTIKKDFDPGADESYGFTLKVAPNPDKPAEGIAHFFDKEASSTFIVKRKGMIVTASYHGRNETPNTHNPRLKDNIRNTIVALGAMAGISELQWNALLKGLLDL